jgi:hypothetical protein
MSFWQSLFGGAPAAPPAPITHDVELIAGELSARVVRHGLIREGVPVPCWTYVTKGLAARGQKEAVLSLLSSAEETEFPRDPLAFFEQLYRLAGSGRTVEEGDYTCFRAPEGFLDTFDQTGFVYLQAQPLQGIELPAGALCAVLLTGDEAELVPVIGAYRVTALLGKQAKHYPCPFWSERGRPSVLTREDMETSVLRKLPLAVYPGSTACLELPPRLPAHEGGDALVRTAGARLRIRLPLPQPAGFRDTVQQLPAEWSLALLTWPAPEARMRLVWKPGQGAPETIRAEGADATRLTGGFVLLAAGTTMPTGARITEDGFAVYLSPEAASEARSALVNGGPLQLEGEGELFDFEVEWVPGAEEKVEEGAVFRVERTVMYQADEMLRERVPRIEALTEYLERVAEASANYWEKVEPGAGRAVLLAVALRPGGRVRFWADSPVPLEPIIALPWLRELEALPVPPVNGQVAVGLEAVLWKMKGSKPPQWPLMPSAWLAATANRAVMMPDGVLDAVWLG